MHENPYQSPLPEEPSRPRYASRIDAARGGALQGGLWAAKWTTIIFSPVLLLPWPPVAMIVLCRNWDAHMEMAQFLSLTLQFITGLSISIVLLGTLILLMAAFGAAFSATHEAIRFREITSRPNASKVA